MKEYLVFRLFGPMASWGLPAVGGDRTTAMQPTRSAILGLMGAALGIKRDNEVALTDLQQSICIAIKQCVPGSLMRDYHTSQVPSHNNKVVHRTRKSELGEDKLNTILSSRDYCCDGLWIVAISLAQASIVSLDKLQDALKKPVYTLSLGRKSCPLAAPLQPVLIKADNLKAALDTEFPALTRSHKEDALWLGFNGRVTYFWEGDKAEIDDVRVLTTNPWDEPVHRERWQFKQRAMHQLSVEEVANVSV
ncbi:type I-E CRISPR-associated protein Cas5/CasD [Amphritea sp. 1_MG-2023]|uniref:type I-E CRISPR-associated protein Cas5/CasD n=1 Tax=Amphritea sp. 1_MG-2023 TaxID=3062670 RepID=UPI0026E45745|nr:type I-E CRISPR-associated protein Cas5/CasD [Amphritea sp. 1_MG-2023]MDO6564962.1 type I-E CRISPR-associated protein Cas5/CasD [Amphritea sp. 1_MG-2023]